jgi:hypothetical protein
MIIGNAMAENKNKDISSPRTQRTNGINQLERLWSTAITTVIINTVQISEAFSSRIPIPHEDGPQIVVSAKRRTRVSASLG